MVENSDGLGEIVRNTPIKAERRTPGIERRTPGIHWDDIKPGAQYRDMDRMARENPVINKTTARRFAARAYGVALEIGKAGIVAGTGYTAYRIGEAAYQLYQMLHNFQ